MHEALRTSRSRQSPALTFGWVRACFRNIDPGICESARTQAYAPGDTGLLSLWRGENGRLLLGRRHHYLNVGDGGAKRIVRFFPNPDFRAGRGVDCILK